MMGGVLDEMARAKDATYEKNHDESQVNKRISYYKSFVVMEPSLINHMSTIIKIEMHLQDSGRTPCLELSVTWFWTCC